MPANGANLGTVGVQSVLINRFRSASAEPHSEELRYNPKNITLFSMRKKITLLFIVGVRIRGILEVDGPFPERQNSISKFKKML